MKKNNNGKFVKGMIPWNKGLKGWNSGPKNPNFGKHINEKAKEKMRIAKLKNPTRYWLNKKRIKESIDSRTITRRKNGFFKNIQKRKIDSKIIYNKLLKCPICHCFISKNKIHNCKEVWGKIFNIRKPTSPERLIIRLIKENNLPFNYVGDGKIWFERFNPDFLSKNPKHIIEIFGDYWHKNTQERDKLRLETYNKYGYKTLVIWEHELKDLPSVLNKIQEFIK